MIQLILLAAEQLTPEEQSSVELYLTFLTAVVVILIVGLIALALMIRYISRRTTAPCRWCMEFIPRKATVCPRCGKNVVATEGTESAESVDK